MEWVLSLRPRLGTFNSIIDIHCYRQQTKLREGNFSQASVCPQGERRVHQMHHGICSVPPLPGHQTCLLLLWTSGSYYWRPVQTCSLENLPPPLHEYRHLVVATETCMVASYWNAV